MRHASWVVVLGLLSPFFPGCLEDEGGDPFRIEAPAGVTLYRSLAFASSDIPDGKSAARYVLRFATLTMVTTTIDAEGSMRSCGSVAAYEESPRSSPIPGMLPTHESWLDLGSWFQWDSGTVFAGAGGKTQTFETGIGGQAMDETGAHVALMMPGEGLIVELAAGPGEQPFEVNVETNATDAFWVESEELAAFECGTGVERFDGIGAGLEAPMFGAGAMVLRDAQWVSQAPAGNLTVWFLVITDATWFISAAGDGRCLTSIEIDGRQEASAGPSSHDCNLRYDGTGAEVRLRIDEGRGGDLLPVYFVWRGDFHPSCAAIVIFASYCPPGGQIV